MRLINIKLPKLIKNVKKKDKKFWWIKKDYLSLIYERRENKKPVSLRKVL